jgi:Tol biopolymer transport system component
MPVPASVRLATRAAVTVFGSALLLGGAGCGGAGEDQASQAPGGDLALFRVTGGSDTAYDLVTVAADGGDLREVIGDSKESEVRPTLSGVAWSPNAHRLAFAAQGDEFGSITDIYTVRPDGTGLRRLTHDGSSRDPVWVPGSGLVFSRVTGASASSDRAPSGSELWGMRADGSERRRLTSPPSGSFDIPGSASPTGSTVVFTRYRGLLRHPDRASVYVIGLNSSNTRLLTEPGADPTYAPNGTRIAFVSPRDHNGRLVFGEGAAIANELYVMNVDGTGLRRLTETRDVNEAAPSWSPDGDQIAYQRGVVTGNAQATAVFSISPVGDCAKPIASDPGFIKWYGRPAWSPTAGGPGGSGPC